MTLNSPAPAANANTQRDPAHARAGIGFKPQHFHDLMETPAAVDFIEVHAENYMGAGGLPHRQLAMLRERFPLSIHGVGLSIGGATLDEAHLERLRTLVARYQPELVSEHLAWSSHDGAFYNDLLPVAYDGTTLRHVVRHIDRVQERLGRPLLLENPSTYVAFEASKWDEVDFIAEIARRTGCGLLLDVNNVQVSCVNHGRDPYRYLEAFPLAHVREIHLAGYAPDADGAGAPLLIDAHDRPVQADVWALYARALELCGATPTLIEWDNDVPDARTLFAEAGEARLHLANARNPARNRSAA